MKLNWDELPPELKAKLAEADPELADKPDNDFQALVDKEKQKLEQKALRKKAREQAKVELGLIQTYGVEEIAQFARPKPRKSEPFEWKILLHLFNVSWITGLIVLVLIFAMGG